MSVAKLKLNPARLTITGCFIYIPCGLKGMPVEGQFAPIDFIHPVLNKAVRTISGHYLLSQEKRLPFNGREVLYFIGCAVVDTSCCGPGGCSYALVPGYVKDWKYKTGINDLSVSRVEPIRDAGDQSIIRQVIMKTESVQQVNFEG
jgi:hypothetical protein